MMLMFAKTALDPPQIVIRQPGNLPHSCRSRSTPVKLPENLPNAVLFIAAVIVPPTNERLASSIPAVLSLPRIVNAHTGGSAARAANLGLLAVDA